jgi:hypothetical protein
MGVHKILKQFYNKMKTDRPYGIFWIGLFLIPLFYLPQFRELYIFPKWILIYVVSLWAFIDAVAHDDWQFPKFSRGTKFFLGLTFVFLVFNIFFHQVLLTTHHTLDRLSFIFLTLFFFRYFQTHDDLKDILIPLFLSTSFILGIGYLQLFEFEALLPLNIKISATFGNINMSAEFMGIALLFQFYSLISLSNKHKILRAWGYILSVLTLSYIYFTHCRSVTLACFGAFGFLYFFKKGIPGKKLLSIILFSILWIGIISYLSNLNYGWVIPGSGAKYIFKESSALSRWDIILNALNAFFHHPFGTGIGRYEFSVIPYQIFSLQQNEFFTHTSPHCEPLRILMEDGLHVFIAGALFFFSFIRSSWLKMKQLSTNTTSVYILALVLYLILESLFQFPLEMASPFFFASMSLGYIFSKSTTPIHITIPSKIRTIVIIGIGGCMSYLAVAQIMSRYYDFMYPASYDKSLIATKLVSNNFFAYRNLIALDLKKRDLLAARMHIKEALKASPYNFLILKDLAALAYFEQNQNQECRAAFLYDQMFQQTSTLHSQVSNICSPEQIQEMSQKNSVENYQSLLENL